MRSHFEDKNRRRDPEVSWSPLLVLGLSVMASLVLIGACMAMMSPDGDPPAQRLAQAR